MTSDVVGREQRIPSFRQFWPFYVREHSRPGNRRLHFIGSTLVLIIVAVAVVTARPLWLLAAPLAGYGFAWVGHFGIEKNRPATFKYPLWSFISDWIMYGKIIAGTMDAEVAAATRSANRAA